VRHQALRVTTLQREILAQVAVGDPLDELPGVFGLTAELSR
jgi:hypothetical protein